MAYLHYYGVITKINIYPITQGLFFFAFHKQTFHVFIFMYCLFSFNGFRLK